MELIDYIQMNHTKTDLRFFEISLKSLGLLQLVSSWKISKIQLMCVI